MKKNLGQHFLTSQAALAAIIDALAPAADDTVVEIGPGTGFLTQALLTSVGTVIAIEKDEALMRELKRRFAAEVANGKLNIVYDDIRNFHPSDYTLSAKRYKLIGNIPYYITGKILRIVLSADSQPSRAVFIVQKEVAERIACLPRRAKRGAGRSNCKESVLSISVQAYGTPRYVKTIKRGSFTQPPKVDSAILAIDNISRDLFRDVDEKHFFEIVKQGFRHKRKQLKNNLAVSEEAFATCTVPKDARAEELSLTQWKCLAQQVA